MGSPFQLVVKNEGTVVAVNSYVSADAASDATLHSLGAGREGDQGDVYVKIMAFERGSDGVIRTVPNADVATFDEICRLYNRLRPRPEAPEASHEHVVELGRS